MKQKKTLAWTAFALCLCTSWIASGSFADSKNPAGDKAKSHVKIVDGQKVLVPADETKASPKPVGRLARPEYQEYLRKLESRLSNQPSAPSDDDAGGDPRGDPEGACCDPSSGVCSIRTQQACTNVGGNYLGNGTTCLPVNPCPQPIDCNLGPDNPVNQFTLFPPDPDFDPFATFLSDVDAGQIAAQGYFSGAAGEVRVVRWWGVELSGAANCNRTNNNFDITFFADADLLGNSPTVPTPEIVAQFPNVTAVRLKAKSFTFEDPGQESYGGSLLWEYTVTLPQRVAMYSGWVAIQATADGTPCNFRWMCSDFGPGWLEHNGQPVEDPDIHDASICVSGTGATVSGACCDDSVQGGSCTNNVQASQCHDFDGGDHRFRPDITCAQVTPACGSITGSCCVGATCTVVTGAQCETAGGSFIAFEDCDTNPCVGACCLGDGGCVEILENDCLGQTGQFFGDGTLCSQTACPGTGRCCSNAGQTCTISTEPACDAIAGSRWDEGLNCATPCPIPPTNDECANALAITCGQTITVDVTEATTGGDDPDFPCSGGGVNSVWFTFVPTASSATIRTCASLPPANDSIIQIFDGTCGAFGAPLMCGEDECGLLSTICVPNLIIGNTYYIQLSAFSAFSLGAYSLEIVCPGETCQSTGSCCLSSGGCVVVSEPACGDQGGVYNGDSTICEEVGACCTGVGDACLPSTEQCCTAAGFTFLGAGTTCGSALGEPQEFSASPNTAIPDANAAGVSSTISVADAFSVG
ncbi:MAG TPA: hypothetical protein VNT79_08295, partial [Phycisphaerae bacterium]|nr:hypothetical protein [Phycisphaerae bacterium]